MVFLCPRCAMSGTMSGRTAAAVSAYTQMICPVCVAL